MEKEQKTPPPFSPKVIAALADEVAKKLVSTMPHPLSQRSARRTKKNTNKLENGYFLDTSAIIDGRIFAVADLGLFNGPVMVLESILLELKHIADSQDAVRRERGRNGLAFLEKLKKTKGMKVIAISSEEETKMLKTKIKEVDEKLIAIAKSNKGKILTCDFNLEKKASIQGVFAINVNALANALKIRAVPGEALHIKILHHGKDVTQGVGYLDDGTMIVIENGSGDIGKTADVVVARVIQTAAGRILFAKKI